MANSKEVVVLASGGMDSTSLLYELVSKKDSVRALFVDYGQHCAKTELATLREVLPASVQVTAVSILGLYSETASRLINEADLWSDDVSYEELYLPYRSLLLLTVGSAYAQSLGINALYAGFIDSNHALEIDCSADFFGNLEPMLSRYGSVQLRLPYRHLTKREVALRGIEYGAPIGRTFSCQVGSSVPCGACPNCVDRLDALASI